MLVCVFFIYYGLVLIADMLSCDASLFCYKPTISLQLFTYSIRNIIQLFFVFDTKPYAEAVRIFLNLPRYACKICCEIFDLESVVRQ